MSGFWRIWLRVWALGVALFGIVLASAAFEATSGPTRALFDAFGSPLPTPMDHTMHFALALMGAVSIGWAITLLAVFDAADRLGAGAAPIWRLVTLSVAVWFVVDSTLSVMTGIAMNAASNTVLLVAFMIPIVASGALKSSAA